MMYRIYRRISSTIEYCFYIQTTDLLSRVDLNKLNWLIAETFEPDKTGFNSWFSPGTFVEIGPRLSIETPFSSNAVSICRAIGLAKVVRIEFSRRCKIDEIHTSNFWIEGMDIKTEQVYPENLDNLNSGVIPEKVKVIDLLDGGIEEFKRVNKVLGLGMDEQDIDYYLKLFRELNRNPTDVELFQIGNANSEHSRHWYFSGEQFINGSKMPQSLIKMVKGTLKSDSNSLLAFNDNSGAMKGFKVSTLYPRFPQQASDLVFCKKLFHLICTAETHSHPTYVSPFEGATTGPGGRIRDIEATGRGAIIGAGSAGYSIANLFVPDWIINGEVVGAGMQSEYASALRILIEGSNGVSSYGNKIGEPLVVGYLRSYEQMLGLEHVGYRKPILYTGGIGRIADENLTKGKPEVGFKIVRIGGPAYAIGVGGGAASSVSDNSKTLNLNSVQRGNPEMENRVNRVIRNCSEMGRKNPIISIHDQGAGGPSNVLTELMEPLGGEIDIRKITLGDTTMSVLQIWSAEFQESYGLLIKESGIKALFDACERERVPCDVVGEITGTGNVVLVDGFTKEKPVDLNLEKILTGLPRKTYSSDRKPYTLTPFTIPHNLSINEAIEIVFKLPSVGSKGFLTNKIDTSVTGNVRMQPRVGIAQISVADAGVVALSHFGVAGTATALGEQPIIGLIDPKAGARMSIAEMLTNIACVKITRLGDIKMRWNWTAAAKTPSEGARLYDAVEAGVELASKLGIAVDGGKDSLSPIAKVEGRNVKSPLTLVVKGYAPIKNIWKVKTPDVKKPGASIFLLIDLGFGKNRMGGSSLAQALNQLGNEAPDVDCPALLENAFNAVQEMVQKDAILSIHDRSGGGLITAVAEMCMASRCGFDLVLDCEKGIRNVISKLFSEELGFVFEVADNAFDISNVQKICDKFGFTTERIGSTSKDDFCKISLVNGTELWRSTTPRLRYLWESTSSRIEELQGNPECAKEEHDGPYGHGTTLPILGEIKQHLSFVPEVTNSSYFKTSSINPRALVLREEGTNGEVEMASACKAAGFNVCGASMSDLLSGKINLNDFKFLVYAGGFSFMDTFGSGKGWGGVINFNSNLKAMFDEFCFDPSTLSLGVCNGAQLMPLIGWVPGSEVPEEKRPRFINNKSSKFESRFVNVKITKSPSILLDGMEGSDLGVWVAHGEGRYYCPDNSILKNILDNNLAPIRYSSPYGDVTEIYPFNPNGSTEGIASICSLDGRHLAMMPHPERCFLKWQLPFMPADYEKISAAPWLRLFQNARKWCAEMM